MRTDSSPSEARPLETLVAEATGFLQQQGYAVQGARHVRHVWRRFTAYAEASPEGAVFSTALVERFVREAYPSPQVEDLTPIPRRIQTGIRAMRMLTDFAIHGRWVRHSHTTPGLLADEHQHILDACMAEWYRGGRSARAWRPCGVRLRQFLLYLQHHNTTYRQITPALISAFLTTQFEFRQKTVQMITYYLRTFLRFLYLHDYLPTDWSGDVPHVRVINNRLIPATWRAEDVTRLLASVDRGNPTGKRDYAILMLVTRLPFGALAKDAFCHDSLWWASLR